MHFLAKTVAIPDSSLVVGKMIIPIIFQQLCSLLINGIIARCRSAFGKKFSTYLLWQKSELQAWVC